LYFTVLQGMQEAIIQLIATDEVQANTDIAQWNFAKSLSHPHLAKVFDAGRCVMDDKSLVYVVGETSSTNLAKMIEGERLGEDRAKEIFHPIVGALSYLHSSGVVHGHLNPSNIHFAGSKPRLLLTDLVIAGPVKRNISAPSDFDAPEVRNGEVTAAADTWSLGLTMWEAMTQTHPSPDLWREKEPEVPDSLPSPFREIVQDCLRLDPLRRCTLETVEERLSASNAMQQSNSSIPAKEDLAVIEGAVVDGSLPAKDSIAVREVPTIDQLAARFSAPEEIETEASSDAALFSGTLGRFEDAHLPRSRVLPYAAAVLLAVIGVGGVWFVREHKAGASSTAPENATANTTAPAQKQEPAPAPPAVEQTEPAQMKTADSSAASPEQSKDAAQTKAAGSLPAQGDGSSQAETQNAPAVNQPIARKPDSADHEQMEANAKAQVEKRVLPTVSPGARGGMTRPVEVLIRVSVNPEGTVSDAAYVVPGPGNYFAKISQRAALSWKFKPPVQNGDRERSVWMLKFNFARAGTEATATEQQE
jgi:serine/threonine protein kinase